MKVLVLSHMYPSSFNEVAGIFVHEQVKALIKKEVEVRVISPIPWTPFPINRIKGKWRKYSQVPSRVIWDDVEVFYPRYLTFPCSWFFASSGKRMYRGIEETIESIYQEFSFDLIHAHVALPDGYAGMLLAQKYQKPLVVTIHGQDLQQTVHRNTKCRCALTLVFDYALQVILVSNKLKYLAEEFFDCREKLIVIPNGVDLKKVAKHKFEDLSNCENIATLLSVSNLVHPKGIDLNLLAVQRLRSKYPWLHYLVVGGGPLENKLRQMAASLGLDDCIEFLGRQPHDRVMQYMADCDIFTLPSWDEAFGVVYIEAMAHGKPVIGCQGEGIEDFVEHGKTGMLVQPRDVDSLVEALDFLLSHPEEAKAMGERGRKLVLENYTWEKNAEKTIAVYEDVLKHAGR